MCIRDRSGLIRTAENLLLSLADQQEVDITLCASLSFEVLQYSKQYAGQHAALEFAGGEYFRSRFYLQIGNGKLPPLQKRIRSRQAVAKLLRRMLEVKFNPLQGVNIANFDVYHSPYHALPRHIRKMRQIPSFLTVHDIIPLIRPEYFGLPEQFSGRHFDKEYNLFAAVKSLDPESWIICPSRATRNDLCNYAGRNIDHLKTTIIPWAASSLFYPCSDRERFQRIRRTYNLPEGPYLLSLSTLEPRKNIEMVIRSFVQLVRQENLPDLSLVLAGGRGWQYENIFKAIENSGNIKNRIVLTGYVADKDLASLYSNAMAFVYPSFYEGFGLPPLEAMQCGLPVITSNTSSLPEVVENAGLMMAPNDDDALCHHILSLYKDNQLRKTQSEKALRQSEKFSWEACGRQTAAAYRRALST